MISCGVHDDDGNHERFTDMLQFIERPAEGGKDLFMIACYDTTPETP